MNRTLENPYYYLDNFQTVLRWVAQRYSDLITNTEAQFLQRFPTLPLSARALLARMVMRQGMLFRTSKLRYNEIGDPARAAAALIEQGWVDDRPMLTLEQLFALCTKAELLKRYASILPDKNAKKAELLVYLQTRFTGPQSFDGWYGDSTEPVYHLLAAPWCERIRLMFFGNLRQGWSEFVLADLGLYTFENVEFPASSRAFQTRDELDAYMRLHECRERFRRGTCAQLVLNDVPLQAYDNEWLERRRAKLLFQIAYHHEQAGDWTQALDIYSQCPHPGARVRAIRTLERSKRLQDALDLALAASRQPESESETQQLDRMVPRLLGRLGHDKPARETARILPSRTLTINRPQNPCCIEELVRIQLQRPDSPVFYVENALVNSLFGLLCWDAIFAPVPGAFFHPFQRGPADLHSADFTHRRQARFASCLRRLDTGQYQDVIRRNFRDKAGIESVFVSWKALSEEILDHALTCIPASHLKRWFERLLLTPRLNRCGFPDLIQFWPEQRRYLMIEVKGPGDRLQDNQRRLLDYCMRHGMPVTVCYAQWAVAAP